jgi:hypothetical protein
MDRNLLVAPEPVLEFSPAILHGIEDSAAYLRSEAMLPSLERDSYWPKWNSPWWHMLLLFELGLAQRIPERALAAMQVAIESLRLHIFPIHPGDAPPGTDPHRDYACHCALGCMAQVLTAGGFELARSLPWVPSWFVRYQMADGGLNCDEKAYLCHDECPSSMVGTIAPFEALLDTAKTAEEQTFVARSAQFLIGRKLMNGSPTQHNAEEREAAKSWILPCFPRFYFYDVLRGLAALVRFAEITGATLPRDAIEGAVGSLSARFPDGIVRVERQAFAGKTTILPTADRTPSPRSPATSFALLEAVSVIGDHSVALTKQWTEVRQGLLRLLDADRIL